MGAREALARAFMTAVDSQPIRGRCTTIMGTRSGNWPPDRSPAAPTPCPHRLIPFSGLRADLGTRVSLHPSSSRSDVTGNLKTGMPDIEANGLPWPALCDEI